MPQPKTNHVLDPRQEWLLTLHRATRAPEPLCLEMSTNRCGTAELTVLMLAPSDMMYCKQRH